MNKFSLGKYLLPTYISLAFIFLMFPIGYTFVFSFNDPFKNTPAGRALLLITGLGFATTKRCVRHLVTQS